MEIFGQAAVGIIVLLVVIGGLLYLFYSRTNAVEKTGYGALTMLVVVTLMIPVFWILETGNQAHARAQLQALAVNRGMKLYAEDCVTNCYAIKAGTKSDTLVDPKYNGYTVSELNQKTDDELRRIVSGGVYNPTSTITVKADEIPKLTTYGGQLSTADVDYLVAFIRSADADYLKKQGFTEVEALVNGFAQFPAYLKTNFAAKYSAAVSLAEAGQFGTAVDRTKDKAITINMVNTATGAICDPSGCFALPNIKVKVGTVITWVNTSALGHTVTALEGTNTASPTPATQIFDSGDASKLIPTGGKFTYTVTEAAYSANADHTIIYYCRVHPKMLAELTITK